MSSLIPCLAVNESVQPALADQDPSVNVEVSGKKIPRDIKPKSATLTLTGLEVIWDNDDHKSHYSYSWLQNHSYDPKLNDPYKPEGDAKITWDNSIVSSLPEVSYNDVMNSDQGLAAWLNNI
ncbi:hypothetical protein BGX34_005362, partial [Mortierella sp. NVP85]